MKKVISMLLVLMLVVGCFAACGNDSGSSSEAGNSSNESSESSTVEESSEDSSSEASATDTSGGEKFKVGILAPAVTHGWVAGVAYYAQERCEELSDTVEYRLLTSNNAEEMTNQIDELKTWGAQAVVAFPQWEGMEDPIKGLIDAGVPVVNFDIVIDVEGVYHVAGDNVDMGTQSAQYMYYETAFTREAGLADFTDVLSANPQIDAVFSMDDETSIGVLQAISEAKRTDIKVVTGGGGCQEYFNMMPENEEIWIQSALYSPDMVKDAVDVAVALLKGESPDVEKIIPTTIVDRENCTDYLDEKSPY